ncbi:hypothetical protein K493DRAFT_341982 [Basidiobolus meristosporus CBS 931.73]|uniref:Uncharacterized protein n=1 Tax=Basidiobolus meristosporus CBS 931.73 TaxID=1314790 RepID=A0A1Y1XEQ5_9FUNG|nr:hypothetical protein K493DRAFT_341982 [Basidiobolus meristosporus CBS 931.73]|eukprot:ORX83854.1 hypothetical protein K493DRAFT_341982 [Basidiobolus meristosporus CBS 931.73]
MHHIRIAADIRLTQSKGTRFLINTYRSKKHSLSPKATRKYNTEALSPTAREKKKNPVPPSSSPLRRVPPTSTKQEYLVSETATSVREKTTPKTLAEISLLNDSNSQGSDMFLGSPDSHFPRTTTPTFSAAQLGNVDEAVKSIEEFLQKDVELFPEFELGTNLLTDEMHLKSLLSRRLSQTETNESPC